MKHLRRILHSHSLVNGYRGLSLLSGKAPFGLTEQYSSPQGLAPVRQIMAGRYSSPKHFGIALLTHLISPGSSQENAHIREPVQCETVNVNFPGRIITSILLHSSKVSLHLNSIPISYKFVKFEKGLKK